MGRALGPLYDRNRLFRSGGCKGNLLASSISYLWSSVLLRRVRACTAGGGAGLGECAQRPKEVCRRLPQGACPRCDSSPAAIVCHCRRKVCLRCANTERG